MKGKKEYIILVAVIVALGLYLVFRSPDRAQYSLPQLPEIDTAEITKIEIAKPEISIVLDREGDNWLIGPDAFRADRDKVKAMLETMDTLTVTALVSESKSYNRYELDDDKKISVKAWTGDELTREFDLGKAASSFRHTFVKLAGDDRVYHGRGNFRGTFDQTVDNLRDKQVLSFDPLDIHEMSITKDKEDLTLARAQRPVEVSPGQDGAEVEGAQQPGAQMIWQTEEGKRGNEKELNRMVTTLSNLRCETYVDDKNKEDFVAPIYTIVLKGAEEHTLNLFAKTDEEAKNYPAVSSGNAYPFLLPQWQVENLMKKPEDLLEDAAQGQPEAQAEES